MRWATVIVASFVLLSVGNAFSDDWARWRGPHGNGVSDESQWNDKWPADGPKASWRAQVGTGFSSFAVAKNRVLTTGNCDDIDTLYCFEIDSGKLNWKYACPSPLDDRFFEGGPTSTPTVDGNRVYSLTRQGNLSCLKLETGELLWSKNVAEETGSSLPGWGFSSSPVVHDQLLLLGVGEAGTALDKRDGKIIWSTDRGEAGYMTPYPLRIDNHWYVLIASGRAFQCVDLENGKVAWKHRWLTTYGCNAADPIVDANKVFISSGYNRGSALLNIAPTTVSVVWANKEMQNQLNSSVKVGSCVYGFHGNDTGEVELRCLDFSTGKPQWSYSGLGLGSLMAAGGRLIVLAEHGDLIIAAADSTGFQPSSRAKILAGKCWTVPVLSNGRIFCRNASGEVVCVDVRLSLQPGKPNY